MQTFIAFGLLIVAGAFLGWNFIGKKFKSSSEKKDCGPDCNCS